MYRAIICICIFALIVSPAMCVDIHTRGEVQIKDTYDKVVSGDISGITTLKLSLSGSEKTYQYNAGNTVVIDATDEKDIHTAQVSPNRIEGYYTYAKSNSYPWGVYWCIHNYNAKPVLVYSEFSGRKVWYAPISTATVEKILADVEGGNIPDILTIQKVVNI